jgi:hypothetical protein
MDPVYVYVVKRQERMGRLKTKRLNSVQKVLDELERLGIDPVASRVRILSLNGVESFRSPYYGLVTVEYPVAWELPARMKENSMARKPSTPRRRNYSYGSSDDLLTWGDWGRSKYGEKEMTAKRGLITYVITKFGDDYNVTREEPGMTGNGVGDTSTVSRAKEVAERDYRALMGAYPARHKNPTPWSWGEATPRSEMTKVEVGAQYRRWKVVDVLSDRTIITDPKRDTTYVVAGKPSVARVRAAIDELAG